MKATAIAFPWRENALALALGLAIIGIGAGLAHSQTPATLGAAGGRAGLFLPGRNRAAGAICATGAVSPKAFRNPNPLNPKRSE